VKTKPAFVRSPIGSPRKHKAIRFEQKELDALHKMAKKYEITFSEAVRLCVRAQIGDKK